MASSFYRRATDAFRLPLETPHLVLRILKSKDNDAVEEFCNADDWDFMQRWYPDLEGKDLSAMTLRSTMHGQYKDTLHVYNFQKGTGKIVGLLELFEDTRHRERLSYYTLPSERGKGYAFEAYKACFNHCVETGLFKDKVYAHIYPGNTASGHFLRAAGFHSTGIKTIRHPDIPDPYEVKTFLQQISDTTRIRQKKHIPV